MNHCLQGRPGPSWPGRIPPLPPTGAHGGHTDGALPGNEQLHQVQVAAGGRSVQGRPALTVTGIDLSPGVQELLHHLSEVIDAALQTTGPERQSPGPVRPPPIPRMADLVQGRQAILVGQVRADPTVEELADCEGGSGVW